MNVITRGLNENKGSFPCTLLAYKLIIRIFRDIFYLYLYFIFIEYRNVFLSYIGTLYMGEIEVRALGEFLVIGIYYSLLLHWKFGKTILIRIQKNRSLFLGHFLSKNTLMYSVFPSFRLSP